MSKVCSVCKKSESDSENLNFFSLPKTQQLKEKWLKILNIKHEVIPENYTVCSLHFLNSDIKDMDGTPTLKRTAVPLNKTTVNTANDILSESPISRLTNSQDGVKNRLKHKMVPVDKTDSGCQVLARDCPPESDSDSTETDEKTVKNRKEQKTDNSHNLKKRKRMKTSDLDFDFGIDESQQSVFSTTSSETVNQDDTVAVEDHANVKWQKRRKKSEIRYQKELMKLHELIKSLDFIGEKFSIEGFSRKVLRAPKSSKLFQFFSPAPDNATTSKTEQINIEIVDDELNVVNETNIKLAPKGTSDVKTEEWNLERKRFLKRKLVELTKAAEVKQQKINELKLILEQKTDIVQELETEVANLKNIITPSGLEH